MEADSEGAPAGSQPLLRWPPPGLERLQGDFGKISKKFFVGGAVLVFPLLWAVGASDSFMSLGPFGEAWWIPMGTSLLGLVILLAGFVDCFRLFRRLRRATSEGYRVRTAVLVAADSSHDTGFLLQGQRYFSTLRPRTRSELLGTRIWATVTLLAASIWLSVGFVVLVLLASRGVGSPGSVVIMTLVPVAMLGLAAAFFRVWAAIVVRKARKEWFEKPWPKELASDEIAGWEAALARRDPSVIEDDVARRRGRRALGVGAAAAFLGAFLVGVPSLVLVGTASVTPVIGAIAMPGTIERTQMRSAAVQPLWRYRSGIDSAVTAQEAGELLQIVAHVGGRTPSSLMRPPIREYGDPIIPDDGAANPTGISPGLWSEQLFSALDTLESDAIAYLREVGGHAALDEVSRLAAAPALDVAHGRWPAELPDSIAGWQLPIPRLSRVRNAQAAMVARAAVAVEDGRPADGERAIREAMTVGLLLGRDGVTLIDNLVGYVVASTAGVALESFYRATGQTERAETLAWSLDVAQGAAVKAQVGLSNPDLNSLGSMPAVVMDTTAIRGLRWDRFVLVSTLAPCLNINRIVFGPDPEYESWLRSARRSLVRFPSEEPLFEKMEEGYFGRARSGTAGGWFSGLTTLTMGGSGEAGSCAAMFESLSTAEVIGE